MKVLTGEHRGVRDGDGSLSQSQLQVERVVVRLEGSKLELAVRAMVVDVS